MRTRWAVRGMVAVLVASLAPFVAAPGAAAAGQPSEPLPETPSVAVTQETRQPRDTDEATANALTSNQDLPTALAGAGTSSATSLSPSATWDVATNTGDFTWEYPLRVPPAPGGLTPNLALSYRSSAVDGRTSATNNQSSWVGDGWDLWPGFVERSYGGCVDEGFHVGDLCWRTDNATAAYGDGGGGRLICCDGTGRWRAQSDDGARIERLTGAANGDEGDIAEHRGEYWKVTTVDGTQYFFGSQQDSNATWTVPVFGDDAGEQCHRGGFEASHCVQAYRWNLDKVVDRNGNMIRYYYAVERNNYGMNLKDVGVPYTRGGWLDRIDYGLNEHVPGQPTARVEFTTKDRCLPGSNCVPGQPGNWPDTPLDLSCGTTCEQYVPTFWATKRLDTITTKVRNGSTYDPVERWSLNQQYPSLADGTERAAMWLKEIRHTGLRGGTLDLPPVSFEGTQLANRVTTPEDGYSKLHRYRVTGIISEAGGSISVNYEAPNCRPGQSMPTEPHTNSLRCFPVRWAPKGHAPRTDYFHKYVVASVVQSDQLSTSTQQETRYEYLDGAAWHADTAEFVKDEDRMWNEFRGYQRVRVRTGSATDPGGSGRTMSEVRYHRGMHGDRLPTGTRSVSVLESDGTAHVDHDWLKGFGFEKTTYDREKVTGPQNTDPPAVSRTVTTPVWRGPTATRGPFNSYQLHNGAERVRTAVGTGWRTTKTVTGYDDRGMVTSVDDLGDEATAADDRCTRTTYARNETSWVLDNPATVETVAVACAATPRLPDHAIGANRYGYDARGNLTSSAIADGWPAAGPAYQVTGTSEVDVHGRVTKSTNALGHAHTVAYTPKEGGPVTGTTSTTPDTQAVPGGLVTTTTLDPAFGHPTSVVDPADRRTEIAYDPLGRTAKVWLPNQVRDDNPDGSVAYTYTVRREAPSVVTTTKLGPNGRYVTSNAFFDGLLRPRQAQEPAVSGGRLITDTRYDSHGRTFKTTQPYFNNAAVDKNLWFAADTQVPGTTRTKFDGAGRPIESIYQKGAQNAWSTRFTYGGDRVHVTPPDGGTATTTITDARGRTTELWQYQGKTPDGDHDTTRYEYTAAGELAKVTGPDNAVWRYGYDLRGRKTSMTDPDTGATTMGYDLAGRLMSTTDALGRTVAFGYDKLGRKTSLHEDSTSGPRLAEWTYDTAAGGKGRLAAATRFVGTAAYTETVSSYTALGLPLKTSVVIPAVEGALAGTYETSYGYGQDGTRTGESYPAVPAAQVTAQTVNHGFDDDGRPSTTRVAEGQLLVGATSYTRYGEVERIEQGSGTTRVWQSYYYDTSTRRIERSIVDAEVAKPMQLDLRYTHDEAGSVTSIADVTLDKPADVQCFRHDYLSRLTEAWTAAKADWSADSGCTAAPAVADGPAPYWNSYRHDKGGNRVGEVRRTPGRTVERGYTYAAGQPHTLRSVSDPAGAETYGYNALGQNTSRGKPGLAQTLEWNREGQVASVTGTGGTTRFLYTADGTRLLRRDSAGTTLYLGNQEVRLSAGGGKPVVTRYYTHGGGVVATKVGDRMFWLAGDHQGTAQLAIDSTTLAVSRRRQDPYGNPRGAAQTWPDERGFVGGTSDASTGLTNIGARQYDPATGRFLSADPLMDNADPQQMNGYAYADNSPVTMSDPTGLAAASGPDGECAKFCFYKPGHNPATNHPADFDWNSRNCPHGQSSCTATGGTGKPPQNRSPQNCPDGRSPCPVASGSPSAAEAERQRRAEQARREAKEREIRKIMPAEVEPLIDLSQIHTFDMLAICWELSGSFGLTFTVRQCINVDDRGLSSSLSGEGGLEWSAGAHAAIVIRGVRGARADQIDEGVHGVGSVSAETFQRKHDGPHLKKGWGFQVVGEESLKGKKAMAYEFRYGLGVHGSLGGGAAGQFGLNSGYLLEWDALHY